MERPTAFRLLLVIFSLLCSAQAQVSNLNASVQSGYEGNVGINASQYSDVIVIFKVRSTLARLEKKSIPKSLSLCDVFLN